MRIRLIAAALLVSATTMPTFAADWLGTAGQVMSTVTATSPAAQEATGKVQQTTDTVNQKVADATSLLGAAQAGMNLNPQQAEGGLGLLFSLAQSNLPPEQFSQLSGSVPEMPQLLSTAKSLSAAPAKQGGLMGNVLGVASQLSPQAGGVAQTLASLQQLGITPDMAASLATLVMGYFQGQPQGDATAALFQQGLGSLLGGQ